VVSPYLTWWIEKTEAEMREIEKAKRLRKLKVTEASLCTAGANQHAMITFWKSEKGKAMDRDEGGSMDKESIYELMQKRQAALGNVWPADDEEWCGLYELYKRAPVVAPAPVEKAAQPGDAVWGRICKLAQQLRDEQPGALTEAESIEAVLYDRPDLYRMYCREQAGLE
jgi:hypothetical protein